MALIAPVRIDPNSILGEFDSIAIEVAVAGGHNVLKL
jgi:hypothetical protein